VNRILKITEDGSHTFYLRELDEPFHSMHGALQESKHVFINHGFRLLKKAEIRILEIGFGTGLNTLLTVEAGMKSGTRIHYHAVEKFPLNSSEYTSLNYESFLDGVPEGTLQQIHLSPWEEDVSLMSGFTLHKELSDFREMEPVGLFDLVYFDAFDPGKQPELWSEEVFNKIACLTMPGAIMVTYSSKGVVRRALKNCGFDVSKVPGPPGKIEMIRAIRI